jgi:hypothetical protein
MKSLQLLLLFVVIIGCSQNDIPKETPACIKAKIDSIKAEGIWNPPAKIYRYTYQGKTVYYIPARCCDIPSILLDEGCNVICSPDGGLTGAGDGKCSDFFKERTDEQLVWEDDRNP